LYSPGSIAFSVSLGNVCDPDLDASLIVHPARFTISSAGLKISMYSSGLPVVSSGFASSSVRMRSGYVSCSVMLDAASFAFVVKIFSLPSVGVLQEIGLLGWGCRAR